MYYIISCFLSWINMAYALSLQPSTRSLMTLATTSWIGLLSLWKRAISLSMYLITSTQRRKLMTWDRMYKTRVCMRLQPALCSTELGTKGYLMLASYWQQGGGIKWQRGGGIKWWCMVLWHQHPQVIPSPSWYQGCCCIGQWSISHHLTQAAIDKFLCNTWI